MHRYTAGRGQMQAEQLLEVLAGVAPSVPDSFRDAARMPCARTGTA